MISTHAMRLQAVRLLAALPIMMHPLPSHGQVSDPDLFNKLHAQITEAEISDLPDLDSRVARLRGNLLSAEEHVQLASFIAHRYRGSDGDLARAVARRVINDAVFDQNTISPYTALAWSMAADTFVAVSDRAQLEAFVASVESDLERREHSACLRILQLSMLLDAHAVLETPDAGRGLAEDHLPGILKSLPEKPSHLTLRWMWRLDDSLRHLGASSTLRLKLLKEGSRASEQAIRERQPFNRNHFSNLWHFRLHLAHLYAKEGRDKTDILSALDGISELRQLFDEQMRENGVDASILEEYQDFHVGNVRKIKQLATYGHVLPSDSLVGKQAPRFDLKLTNGDLLRWEDLRGRVVVLDFWAVWCVPCIEQFPDLRELDVQYDDDEVLVVGITKRFGYRWSEPEDRIEEFSDATHEEESAAIRRFLEQHGIQIPQMLDEGATIEKYRVRSWPTTVLLDQEGVVRFAGHVEKRQFANFVEMIEELRQK